MANKKQKLTDEDIQLIMSLEKYGWGGVLSDAAQGGLSGAAAGAFGGPVGIGVGAGIGFLSSLAGGILKDKQQSEQLAEQKRTAEINKNRQEFQVQDDGTGNWLPPVFKNGGDINIKKENRGKFTEYCGGKVTADCIQKALHSSNPVTRKRANFAHNARKWKKEDGGMIGLDQYNQLLENGGMVQQYDGQTHEGPTGGIPVDGQGRPIAQKMGAGAAGTGMGRGPQALVEDGEVAYGGYVFSNSLKQDSKNTYADAAKRILSKYKVRLGEDYSRNDKMAQEALKREMGQLKVENEKARVQSEYGNMSPDKILGKFAGGGDLPPYMPSTRSWDPHTGLGTTADDMGGFGYFTKKAMRFHYLNGHNPWDTGYWDNMGVTERQDEVDKGLDEFNKILGIGDYAPGTTKTLGVDAISGASRQAPIAQPEQPQIKTPSQQQAEERTGAITQLPSIGMQLNTQIAEPLDRSLYDNNIFIDNNELADAAGAPQASQKYGTNSFNKFSKYAGAISAGIGALTNIGRGIFEKPVTHNAEDYMISSRYTPTYMRADEANTAAQNAYADRLRVAQGMSPTQASRYQSISEAANQDRLSRIKENIFNVNAQLNNQAQRQNIGIDQYNAKTRMQVDQMNDANAAAKENMLTTGLSQLGQIGQGISRDYQKKQELDRYFDMMKGIQSKNNERTMGLLNKAYKPVEPTKVSFTQEKKITPSEGVQQEETKSQSSGNDNDVYTNDNGIKVSTSIEKANNPWGYGYNDKTKTVHAYDNFDQARESVESDLSNKIKSGKYKTLGDIIKTFSGASGDKLENYLSTIEKNSDYTRDTDVSKIDPSKLTKAMLYFENKDYVDKVYGGKS